MADRRSPGVVRDAILEFMRARKGEVSVAEIRVGVEQALAEPVAASSIRSYLNINTPQRFLRTERGKYRLVRK